jgi:Tol biopolymer transport system component
VPALGGAERKVAETTPLLESSMCWALDGQSLFTADKDSAGAPFSIFAIDIATSEKQEVTTPPPQDVGDHTPRLSPDGKSLAFIRTRETGIDDVYLFSLNGKKTQRLTFDNLWIYGLAWTADGREIIFPSNRGGGYKFWRILKSGGTPEPIALAGDMVTDPTISWQQNRLAYNQSIYNVNIGQVELTNPANPAPLIVSTQVSVYPHVSPDGEKIAFISNRSGSLEVWTCDRDGMNPLQLTRFSGPVLSMPRWAPDGQQIAFDARGEGRASIYLMRPDGSRQQQLTPGEYEEIFPSWSRDGKWIYFSSNRTGLYQVWKILAKGGEAVQVTRNGGLVANESPDGKFVYYTRSFPDARIWRMPVNAGDEELVFDQIAPDYVAAWALAEKGIFFVNPEARPRAAIEFFDFATRQTTHIAHIVKEPHAWGLTLSPDEKSILYVQLDQTETDIVLVENFR